VRKQIVLWSIIFSLLSLANCASNQSNNATPNNLVTPALTRLTYSTGVSTEPGEVKPNAETKLIFGLQDSTGKTLTAPDLEIVHEKLMHLLIVSEDLSYFDHLHPAPQANGDFIVTTKLPTAGKYQLYLDYTPKGTDHQLGRMSVDVQGTPPAAVPLVVDTTDTKIVDGISVTIKPSKPYRAKDALTLNFAIADAKTGAPITDLEPYLGAFAHFVLIDEQQTEFLHAHPLKDAENAQARGGPEIGTQTLFPKAGIYKVWVQMQRQGKVIVAPFVIKVAEAATTETILAKDEGGVQKLKITVSENGYEPANFQLKRGVPAEITFERTDEKNCGTELVFDTYGIRKELKVGQPVKVNFTPDKDGEFQFTCGMGMLRGAVVVKN
jgi:plastocyanin